MKNKIYLLNINELKNEGIYQRVFSLLSKERISKVNKLRNDNDKLLSIGAELLLKIGLFDELNIPLTRQLEYKYNENNKPYLKDINIKFNISHSGEYVVCLLANEEVGIDIEKIKEANLNVAKRYFSNDEYEQILNSENCNEEFYRLWVLKEANLKYKGTGLKDLNNIDTKGLYFKELNIDGYKCAICVNKNIDYHLEEVKINRYIN